MTIRTDFEKVKISHTILSDISLDEKYNVNRNELMSWNIAAFIFATSLTMCFASDVLTMYLNSPIDKHLIIEKFHNYFAQPLSTHHYLDSFVSLLVVSITFPFLQRWTTFISTRTMQCERFVFDILRKLVKRERRNVRAILFRIHSIVRAPFAFFNKISTIRFVGKRSSFIATWIIITYFSVMFFLIAYEAEHQCYAKIAHSIFYVLAYISINTFLFLCGIIIGANIGKLSGILNSVQQIQIQITSRIIDAIEKCDEISRMRIVNIEDKDELSQMLSQCDADIRDFNSGMKFDSNIKNFNCYKSWIYFPQEKTYEILSAELAAYLSNFVTGKFHYISENSKAQSSSESKKKNVLWSLSLALPLIALLIAMQYIKIDISGASGKILTGIYAIWIYSAFNMFYDKISDNSIRTISEILNTLLKFRK